MSFLERKSVVSYRCSCGRLKPLARVYFCRHCFQLRCEFCVSQEIDSRHCSTCLETQSITDAWMKGNKCSNCMLCPICQSNLSTRIFNAKPKPSGDGGNGVDVKAAPAKSYYLCCLFCHWTTRDIGVPDSSSSANKWPELENPHANRINELVEYYKAVSINDRSERERKNQSNRRYTHISGLSSAIVRQKAGLLFRTADSFQETSKLIITKGVAEEAKDDLPDDIYTTPPDLFKISNLRQRHRLPEAQPEEVTALRYTRKALEGKRSSRCRTCEHNVIKPEFMPTNTKFKIQLSAYYLVPEVRIKTVEPLRAGQPSQLLLLVINPTQYKTTVTFRPYDDPSSEIDPAVASVPVYTMAESPNAEITLSAAMAAGIPLPGRDDVAEFDEPEETYLFNDDPNIVAWRKRNKVVVKLSVRPDEDLAAGAHVLAGVSLTHVYTNSVIQTDKKQSNKIDHSFRLLLQIGTCLGA